MNNFYKLGVIVSVAAGSFAGIASNNPCWAVAVTFGLGAIGLFVMAGAEKINPR